MNNIYLIFIISVLIGCVHKVNSTASKTPIEILINKNANLNIVTYPLKPCFFFSIGTIEELYSSGKKKKTSFCLEKKRYILSSLGYLVVKSNSEIQFCYNSELYTEELENGALVHGRQMKNCHDAKIKT